MYENLLGAGMAGIWAVLAGFFLVLILAIYIYTSFAYMTIARKIKLKSPGLAWIPGVGPWIIANQASKMSAWPWLLFLSLLVVWISIWGMVIYYICIIIFIVYAYIWHWKLYQRVKRPGWWILLNLIPFFGPIIYLILIGIAAWGKK